MVTKLLNERFEFNQVNGSNSNISNPSAIPRSSSLSKRLRRPLSVISISSNTGWELPLSPTDSSISPVNKKKGGMMKFDTAIYRERSSSLNSVEFKGKEAKQKGGDTKHHHHQHLPSLPESDNVHIRGHRRKSSRLESLVKWRKTEEPRKPTICKTSIVRVDSDGGDDVLSIASPLGSPTAPNSFEYTTARYHKEDHSRSLSSESIDKTTNSAASTSCISSITTTSTSTSSSDHPMTTPLSPNIVWIGQEAIEIPHRGANPVVVPRSKQYEDTFDPFDEEDDNGLKYPNQTVRTQFYW